jgi:hypothetical protein
VATVGFVGGSIKRSKILLFFQMKKLVMSTRHRGTAMPTISFFLCGIWQSVVLYVHLFITSFMFSNNVAVGVSFAFLN